MYIFKNYFDYFEIKNKNIVSFILLIPKKSFFLFKKQKQKKLGSFYLKHTVDMFTWYIDINDMYIKYILDRYIYIYSES